MSKILFISGLMLIKTWAIGFFGFHVGGIIHILLAIAILALLIWILNNKSIIQYPFRLVKVFFRPLPAPTRHIGSDMKRA